jgi:hypothetical protein
MKEKLSRRATLKKKRETGVKPATKTVKKSVAHWFDYYKLNYNSFN